MGELWLLANPTNQLSAAYLALKVTLYDDGINGSFDQKTLSYMPIFCLNKLVAFRQVRKVWGQPLMATSFSYVLPFDQDAPEWRARRKPR